MALSATISSELTVEEWEARKKFVGFTDEDAQALREFGPVAETYADEVVEEFYRLFLQFEETRAFFADDAMLNRVKGLQKLYFLGLTKGEYGEDYMEHRLSIGRVHQRIGLSPRWYMGAYGIYVGLVIPRILEFLAPDVEKTQRTLTAFIKLVSLDQELAINAYTAASLEAERISQQAQAILDVSTPVVQLWEGVVAAPLIGTLDSQRTKQFMEELLGRIVDTGSPVALVDITGVPTIDTVTAQHLIEMISAVQLLGAQVILTGVRPAIAQTLVHIGIDLSGVTTRTSLAAGFSVALGILGLEIISSRKDKDGR